MPAGLRKIRNIAAPRDSAERREIEQPLDRAGSAEG